MRESVPRRGPGQALARHRAQLQQDTRSLSMLPRWDFMVRQHSEFMTVVMAWVWALRVPSGPASLQPWLGHGAAQCGAVRP